MEVTEVGIHEITDEACTEEGDDPKGKREVAVVFTEEQEINFWTF